MEIMRLPAPLAGPLPPKQTNFSLAGEAEADISGLIDTLANRVGHRQLYRFAPVASDVPERSIRRIAPMAADAGATWPDQWPRPARLLPIPEPFEMVALFSHHTPVRFIWRGIRRRVNRRARPEGVFGS